MSSISSVYKMLAFWINRFYFENIFKFKKKLKKKIEQQVQSPAPPLALVFPQFPVNNILH